ncbi:hypothetical protein PRUB_a2644 [Pseudoalteromonas rubra]|uniref:Uncharacterized protein n=1 Tax=Pseudoalteromonas rubra TaxID=43658 RepID=A0A8T0CBE3_9GAMM|nr:hypothetical protein [Pseudoalteromonas rubra]KAF7788077.1 hypothetical protein PRUB_a2644 [Pseudoalteromonas rubra]
MNLMTGYLYSYYEQRNSVWQYDCVFFVIVSHLYFIAKYSKLVRQWPRISA